MKFEYAGLNQTLASLLSVELALHAYQLEHKIYPTALAELTPEYLTDIPNDPCSTTGEPPIYRRTADGYLLYSRGYDGDDDGGRPCSATTDFDFNYIDWTNDGDLSLDAYYADENP